MTAVELLCALHTRGCVVRVEGERVHVEGPRRALGDLAEPLRELRDVLWLTHHPALAAELALWCPELRADMEERAGLMQYEGGLPRELALRCAVAEVGLRPAADGGRVAA